MKNSKGWDQLSFRYNMEAGKECFSVDLTSLYTWNLKQLFLYIEVEWTDPQTNVFFFSFGS